MARGTLALVLVLIFCVFLSSPIYSSSLCAPLSTQEKQQLRTTLLNSLPKTVSVSNIRTVQQVVTSILKLGKDKTGIDGPSICAELSQHTADYVKQVSSLHDFTVLSVALDCSTSTEAVEAQLIRNSQDSKLLEQPQNFYETIRVLFLLRKKLQTVATNMDVWNNFFVN